VLEPSCIPSR